MGGLKRPLHSSMVWKWKRSRATWGTWLVNGIWSNLERSVEKPSGRSCFRISKTRSLPGTRSPTRRMLVGQIALVGGTWQKVPRVFLWRWLGLCFPGRFGPLDLQEGPRSIWTISKGPRLKRRRGRGSPGSWSLFFGKPSWLRRRRAKMKEGELSSGLLVVMRWEGAPTLCEFMCALAGSWWPTCWGPMGGPGSEMNQMSWSMWACVWKSLVESLYQDRCGAPYGSWSRQLS